MTYKKTEATRIHKQPDKEINIVNHVMARQFLTYINTKEQRPSHYFLQSRSVLKQTDGVYCARYADHLTASIIECV